MTKIRTRYPHPYFASMLTTFAVMSLAMLVQDLDGDGWKGATLLALRFVLFVGLIAPAAWHWRQFFRTTK